MDNSYYVITTAIAHHWKFKQPVQSCILSRKLPHKSTKDTTE